MGPRTNTIAIVSIPLVRINKKELLCPEYGVFQRAPRGGLDRGPIGRQGGGRIVHPVKKDIIDELTIIYSPPFAD